MDFPEFFLDSFAGTRPPEGLKRRYNFIDFLTKKSFVKNVSLFKVKQRGNRLYNYR